MTITLVILSLFFAVAMSFYQYFYKNTNRTQTTYILSFLRVITIFGILLLLINPIFTSSSFEIQKTPLAIAIDNSASIADLKANKKALEVFTKLKENTELNKKFDIQTYQFDSDFQIADTINFKGKQSNINKVAENLKSINKNRNYPTVLLTDGNQTSGADFVYSFENTNKVYSIVLGDTTTFLDLKIGQLNANKYAFKKNKFPVEVFLQYSGSKTLNANFTISQGSNTLSKQTVSFSPSKKTAVINVLLPANSVGLQIYKANISSTAIEKNTYNNSKNFAVEIIDERSNIAIVSSINHPDLGALKRSIETNLQRKVSLIKPSETTNLNAFNVVIFYQPTAEFKNIFQSLKSLGTNTFTITGTATDFSFLNQNQTDFVFKMSGQKEDYLPIFEANFNLFSSENIGFEQLPPLQNAYGTITTSQSVSVLLTSAIRNIETKQPLLAFAENQGNRHAYLFGENSWKWRLQSHVENSSFEKYDVFIDKIVQFLSSNNTKKSLVVTHENFYNSGDAIEISAQYFNKNYEFDEKARLTISVINKKTKQSKIFDLLKSSNDFKVNLDGLSAGQYTFTVKELNSNTSYNGYFEIMDFDIEKQFVNPDVNKLKQLAAQTSGQVFMPNQTDELIRTLLENPEYVAIEKSISKKTPLIEWQWLLVLIAISLALEWFLRKYNGMV